MIIHKFQKYIGFLLLVGGLFMSGSESAIAAQTDKGFEQFKAKLISEVRAKGASDEAVKKVLPFLTIDREVIRLSRKQPEYFDAIGVYVERRVSEARIMKGQALRSQYASELADIENRFGVDRDMVLAVWGMETNYGSYTGEFHIVRALATLAHNSKRKDFFRRELLTAIQIIDESGLNPSIMKGSWAGAMGHTQFMPTSYVAYAADYDGDGVKDIWNNIPDALASTANYLKKHGWESDKTWGYEVVLPKSSGLSGLGAGTQSIADWESQGLRRAYGASFPRSGDMAKLDTPAGANGPIFLMLKNFSVIRTYNNSKSYALAVGHLADRIGGGQPFEVEWPNVERVSLVLVKGIQSELKRLGHYDAEIDGRPGLGTEEAIRKFQQQAGLSVDGQLTSKLMEHLKKAK